MPKASIGAPDGAFALRELFWPETGRRGLGLVYAATGEIVEGQQKCVVTTETGTMTTETTLLLRNLPLYAERKDIA